MLPKWSPEIGGGVGISPRVLTLHLRPTAGRPCTNPKCLGASGVIPARYRHAVKVAFQATPRSYYIQGVIRTSCRLVTSSFQAGVNRCRQALHGTGNGLSKAP